MVKLSPIRSEKVWGYEDWIASTHPDGCQAEFKELVKDFPLLVKIIQANDTLSVQVHPDDEDAKRLEGENERGKTECWYVLDAEENASLVYGLKKDYSKQELSQAIKGNYLQQLLNQVTVKTGDFIFIPAGTVHAIGRGLRLLEVQQSCNITYRLYDWGRPREVHIEKGTSVIKNKKRKEISPLGTEFECDYFKIIKSNIDSEKSVSYSVSESGEYPELVFITKGQGFIESESLKSENFRFSFSKEDIFALSPGEKINLIPSGNEKTEIIRIMSK